MQSDCIDAIVAARNSGDERNARAMALSVLRTLDEQCARSSHTACVTAALFRIGDSDALQGFNLYGTIDEALVRLVPVEPERALTVLESACSSRAVVAADVRAVACQVVATAYRLGVSRPVDLARSAELSRLACQQPRRCAQPRSMIDSDLLFGAVSGTLSQAERGSDERATLALVARLQPELGPSSRRGALRALGARWDQLAERLVRTRVAPLVEQGKFASALSAFAEFAGDLRASGRCTGSSLCASLAQIEALARQRFVSESRDESRAIGLRWLSLLKLRALGWHDDGAESALRPFVRHRLSVRWNLRGIPNDCGWLREQLQASIAPRIGPEWATQLTLSSCARTSREWDTEDTYTFQVRETRTVAEQQTQYVSVPRTVTEYYSCGSSSYRSQCPRTRTEYTQQPVVRTVYVPRVFVVSRTATRTTHHIELSTNVIGRVFAADANVNAPLTIAVRAQDEAYSTPQESRSFSLSPQLQASEASGQLLAMLDRASVVSVRNVELARQRALSARDRAAALDAAMLAQLLGAPLDEWALAALRDDDFAGPDAASALQWGVGFVGIEPSQS
ncbi:MAG: hypothetical protein U0269_14750 [Polyangiales bacterium]